MKDQVALLVAVAALLALGAGVVYLASQMSQGELQWARLQYLFGAIEAVAFAGAGWLWGKEIHREQAQRAESRLDEAKKGETTAARARGEAEGRLKTLADAVAANVTAITKAHDDIGGGAQPLAAAAILSARPSLDALLSLAQRYQQ